LAVIKNKATDLMIAFFKFRFFHPLLEPNSQNNGWKNLMAIDVFALANLDHPDGKFLVPNGVNNSISSLPDPIPILAGQLFATGRPGIFGQRFDPLKNLLQIAFGYSSKILLNGFPEEDLIGGHLFSVF
jgi:hypothetical protein